MYEGYGPQGVAILVSCLSDNKNRTVAEVRHAFTKYGGNLGTTGSVSYMFVRKAMLMCDSVVDEDAFMNAVLDYDVEDISFLGDGVACVEMSPGVLASVVDFCQSQNLNIVDSDVLWQADTAVEIDDENSEKLERLVTALDELDDVQAVYTSAQNV